MREKTLIERLVIVLSTLAAQVLAVVGDGTEASR